MTIIHGRDGWAQQGDAVPYQVGDYASFDQLHIVAFKSTKESFIRDERGNLVQQELFAYDPNGDGSPGTPSDADFILLEKRVFSYDNLGHLIQSERRDGATGIARVFYTADWKGLATVEGDLKLAETHEVGDETVYSYDTLKRVLTATKKGVSASGGFPEQYDIVTTYTYDANSHTKSTVVSSGSLSLTQQSAYDKAGRTLTETDQAGLTSSFDYSNGGRIITATLPGVGRTMITEQFYDRRTKSVTGTVVVNEYYDYGVDAMEGAWRTVSYGSISSPRWRTVFRNVRNQITREEHPGYSQNVVTTHEFNTFGLMSKTATPGSLVQLYEYNSLGENFREGASATIGAEQLTLDSMDRITDGESFYEGSGNNWYRVMTKKTYLTDNVATPTTISVTKERVRGFTSTGISLHFSPNSLTHAEFEDFFDVADRLDRRRACRC
jgi:YD repeat-containing protein